MAEDDFQAEQDMHTLAEADKIMESPGRILAARDAAMRKQQSISDFLKKTQPKTKGFNDATVGSRMKPKED